MKPSAAFAVGLWTGAVLVLGVGAFNWRSWQRAHAAPSPELQAALQTKDEEIQRLRQQTSSLTVEVQRLRRSVLESKNSLPAETANVSPQSSRRIPFRRPHGGTSPESEQWIASAVVRGDSNSISELEAAAAQNNPLALEGLALLADRDEGAALMRVWNSNTLSESNRVYATRLVASTLEANPRGADWFTALFSTPDVDPKILLAALKGLTNPAFSSKLAALDQRITGHPELAVDVTARLHLFDSVRDMFPDGQTKDALNQMRANLASLAAPADQ
jgi:hypothetical protein